MPFRDFILVLFAAALINVSGLAQQSNPSESIIERSQLAFELAFEDAGHALQLSRKLVNESGQVNDDFALANALNSLGWAFFHNGDTDSALYNLEVSKSLFVKLEKDKEIIQVSLNLSEVYCRKSNYKKALFHLLEADKLNINNKDEALQTDLYRQFAIVYRELKYYDKAALYFKKAMHGFKVQNDIYRYINTGISLSILYRRIGKLDESLNLLIELEKEHGKNKLSDYQLAMIAENLGETYFSLNKFEDALFNFLRAYSIFSDLNFQADLAYESMNVGKSYSRLGKYQEARAYLLRSHSISDSLNLLNYKHESSIELAKLYEFMQDWQAAFTYSQMARILGDSLNVQEQTLQAKELAERYENDKKEQEIELLKTQNELNDSQKKRTKIWIYFLVVVSVASLLIIWLLWNKIQLDKKLEFEKKQTRIAGEIEEERVLNQFAVSMLGNNTLEDIIWNLAQNTIDLMGFDDCVIYLADTERKVLVQYAAAGHKNPVKGREIYNPIEIPFSQGIVGAVYHSGKAEIVSDTSNDPRYIVDDMFRLSELALPIWVNGEVFGVLDSENEQRDFYTVRHLQLMERVVAIYAGRIAKMITEEKLRHNIARDLHDEIGSTVTSINILSKLLLNEQSPKHTDYLHKINEQSGRIMDSMSDIIWAINPNHDSFEQTILRMKEFAVELVEPAGMICNFETHLGSHKRNISSEERKYIFLIFKEAINNAVKYSRASEIHILISLNNQKFEFRIEDNGKGFDEQSVRLGDGIKNIRERAKTIHADIEIKSSEGVGTVILFSKRVSHD